MRLKRLDSDLPVLEAQPDSQLILIDVMPRRSWGYSRDTLKGTKNQ